MMGEYLSDPCSYITLVYSDNPLGRYRDRSLSRLFVRRHRYEYSMGEFIEQEFE